MRVLVLGPVEAPVGTGQPPLKGRLANVLALLAMHSGEAVSQDTVKAEFFADTARNPTAQVVSQLRTRLAEDPFAGGAVGGSYRIDVSTDAADAEWHRRQVIEHLSRNEPHDARRAAEEGLKLWRGEAYAGVPFTTTESLAAVRQLDELRSDLRALRLRALWLLGDAGAIVRDAARYLASEPVNDQFNTYRLLAIYRSEGFAAYLNELNLVERTYDEEDVSPPVALSRRRDPLEEATADFGSLGRVPAAGSRALRAPLHNLPGATYADFVREQELEDLQQALRSETPVVAVIAKGGSGKTSIVHRLCATVLANESDVEAVVWVTDRDEPGTTTLVKILNTIALVTRTPAISEADPDEVSHVASEYLRLHPLLLVIDNFETIIDSEVALWLTRLGGRSKVVITSATRPKAIEQYATFVTLRHPDDPMVRAFIAQLMRRRGMQGDPAVEAALGQISSAAAQNFRLIEWAAGQLHRRDLQSILGDLATGPEGEQQPDVVMEVLLRGGLVTMSESELTLLILLSYYPLGIPARDLSDQALELGIVDLHSALDALVDLMFVEFEFGNPGLYRIDELVASRLRARDGTSQVANLWLSRMTNIAASVGFCPHELSRLEPLDQGHVRGNLEFALSWAASHGRWSEAITISREVRYYYYVRGLWSPTPDVFALRVEAARQLQDDAEELDALVYRLNVVAKQGDSTLAKILIDRIERLLTSSVADFDRRSLADYRHARALHLHGVGQRDEAHKLWDQNLEDPEDLSAASLNANKRWFGISLANDPDPDLRRRGIEMLTEAAADAQREGYQRAQLLVSLELSKAKLNSAPDQAAQVRGSIESLKELIVHVNDPKYLADYHYLISRCFAAEGNAADAAAHEELANQGYAALQLGTDDGRRSAA